MRKELKFFTRQVDLSVSRIPITSKLPPYDATFLKMISNSTITVSDEVFEMAKEKRIADENSSYAEKKIQEEKKYNNMKSVLNSKDRDIEECRKFLSELE